MKPISRNKTMMQTCLLAASGTLLVLALFALFYKLFHIYPFGERSIVWCDMEQQAVPLLLQCKQIIEQGESLLYHPLNAGGMNFYGVFFFFLSNPLSFTVLLTDMPVSSLMNLLVPVKLALAAGSMVIWLRSRCPRLQGGIVVLLGLMYGFSGYGLMYYQNLMWLDVQALAPLLLLSVEAMLHKGKILPYFCCICLQIVFCYYIGYMTVVFLLLYVGLYALCASAEERKELHFAEFWLTSGTAAFATAFVWLPSFLQIARSARSGNLLQRLANQPVLHALGDKFAVLAATTLVMAVLPLLWRKNLPLSTQELRRTRILCVLFAVAVVVDPINAMWHTGSYQAFPLRWAFWPVLICLTLAAKLIATPASAAENEKLNLWSKLGLILLPIAAVTADILLMTLGNAYITSYVETLWLDAENVTLLLIPTVISIAAYVLILTLRQKGKLSQRLVLCVCVVMFSGEMTLHTYSNLCAAAQEDTLYTQTYAAAGHLNDERFYRLKMTRKYAHANMVGALGYPTMAHYTSLTRADYLEGVKKMGYSSYWMEVPSTGGTVLTDALWGVRYQLGQQRDFADWVQTVWTNNVLAIGETSYTLPQAIRVQQTPQDMLSLPDGKRSAVQAYLAKQKLGAENAVVEYPYTKLVNVTLEETEHGVQCHVIDPEEFTTDVRFSFFVEDAQFLYFDLYTLTGTEIGNPRNKSVNLSVNGRFLETDYPQSSNNGLVSLGKFENEYVTVRAVIHQDFTCESFGVFGIREKVLTDAAAALPADDLHYEQGCYTVTTRGESVATLVLAIPYDEGFTAEVNGKPAEVFRVNTCETAVLVPAGEAVVELRFFPPGLKAALVLSGAGLVLFVLYAVLRKKISQKANCCLCFASEKLSLLALAGVFLLIYVMPVVAFLVNIFI
ncbi:MAG: hypothetical protein E7503_00445 [Ruminococcus sp.]|nr:hypothetical protein [Ruminococcus sp.]